MCLHFHWKKSIEYAKVLLDIFTYIWIHYFVKNFLLITNLDTKI